jgi:gamma-glutamyltranspeptidase/glutathione hydrolase
MSPTIVLRNGHFDFAVGSPGGSTIITTVLQILVNHIDFGMPLSKAIWAPRVSQRNAATSDAEQEFYDSPLAQRLTDRYGESLKLYTGPLAPLNTYIGDATGVQALGRGRYQASAEKVREGGGSALVVRPAGRG